MVESVAANVVVFPHINCQVCQQTVLALVSKLTV